MSFFDRVRSVFGKKPAEHSPHIALPVALPLPPTPENAPGLAGWAVDMTQAVMGLELDYSPESIREVDRIIAGWHAEEGRPSDIRGLAFAFGCYVGEIMIRNGGGSWIMPSEVGLPGGMMLVKHPRRLVNPINKALKGLHLGEGESLEPFYHWAIAERDDERA